MRMSSAMLANQAVLDGGLLAIRGGGWRFIQPGSYPATVKGSMVGMFEGDLETLGSTLTLTLEVAGPANVTNGCRTAVLLDASTDFDAVAMTSALEIPFALVVLGPTTLTFTLRGEDGTVLAEVLLPCIEPSPQ